MSESLTPSGPVIRTVGLTRHFTRKHKTVEAVRGLDLEIQPGELVAFLGPNGAGKSTTLRMLTTLIPPTAGRAEVAGHDVLTERAAVRRSIGYVGQGNAAGHMQRGRDEAGQPGAGPRPLAGRRPSARGRAARGVRPDRVRHPAGLHALRRTAPSAGRGHRDGPLPPADVPRRTVDRARPAEPREPAAGDPPAPRGARHHHRAHHPLPGGGRRDRRPGDR